MNRIQKNPTQRQGGQTPIEDAVDTAMLHLMAVGFIASLIWLAVGK